MLVPISEHRYVMWYADHGFPGVTRVPYLDETLVERLRAAAVQVGRDGYELLVMDGYRSPAAQRHLYDVTLADLMASRGLSEDEAREAIRGFVAHPDRVYPHGTGGAVDLTLWRDGAEVWMGTGFDEFSEKAASDWYVKNPPQDDQERAAASDRDALRRAMEQAGFVGLSSEWWHFEYGTQRWGTVTGREPHLVAVVPPPDEAG